MAIDWISTLREQADLVKRVATDVALKLDLPDISEVEASMLLVDVEAGASRFDLILDEMDDQDVEDELFEAGATIADTWTHLTVMTANRVRKLSGFPPIEVGPERER